ncbi:MAG TPA: hypothetical protein VEG68_12145 [Terriglobales bacterium]|nr:hypothetical protein [Terriglobales bacterium]
MLRASSWLIWIFATLLGPPVLAAKDFHTSTDWDVRPSLKYDAICVLNVLSGDPYYLQYYQADYDRLARRLRPEELTAFANLRQRIKDEHGGIISAQLALYFSTVDAESLDDLVKAVDDSSTIQRNLKATPYYDEESWKVYDASRPDLKAAFVALKRIHFESDWEKESQPKVEEAIRRISADLPKYNIIPAVESVLGTARPTNRITVFLIYYSEPHGIKITGPQFLTHYSYPFRIVLRNAIHEMMHPPYDLAHDTELRKDIDSLRSDRFLMDKVEHHDASFGYNTLDGLVEEDCVQALEELLSERFAVGHDARKYWHEQDGGIHVFAVAIYSLINDRHFDSAHESFPVFLKRMFREDRLANGQIEQLNRAFVTGQ